MRTYQLNQLENLTPLTSEMQMTIVGGKKGWLRRLFGKHIENGDDHGNHSNDPNHDKNDDKNNRRGGRG